jgi:hypothetical protein
MKRKKKGNLITFSFIFIHHEEKKSEIKRKAFRLNQQRTKTMSISENNNSSLPTLNKQANI